MKIVSSQVSLQSHTSQQTIHSQVFKTSTDEFSRLISNTKEEFHSKTAEVIENNTKYMIETKEDLPIKSSIYRHLAEDIMVMFTVDENNPLRQDSQTNNNTQDDKLLKFLSSAGTQTIQRINEHYKKNEINFKAQAIIKTTDKEINIDLNITYTKEFYEANKQRVNSAGDTFKDPLIIKYDLSSNYFDSISQELSFKFDINSDGMKLDIPLLKEGSGFLALDKNSNGLIDDGNELFGPNTQNGFAELRQYDEDKNGWIDENDSIFKDLVIWSKNERGNDTLMALGDANVAAIYLKDITTDFHYDKSVHEGLAYLKQSSIFLTQEGKAGLVTGVDFKVS